MQICIRSEHSKCADADGHVVDAATPLLGRDIMKSLQLSVHNGESVHAVDRQENESVSVIAGFVHRVKVRSDVPPVQQRLRHLT